MNTLFLLPLLLPISTSFNTYRPPRSLDPKQVEELRKLRAKSINNFGQSMLLSSDQEENNSFLSPTSVFTALSMAASGAAEETLDQFNEVLHLGSSNSRDGLISTTGLLTDAKHRENTPQLYTEANAIWIADDLRVEPTFITNMETVFDGTAQKVSFGLESAVTTINSWVKEHTNGLIEDIVENLSASTRLVITNALHFKMGWKTPFEKAFTKTEPFRPFNAQPKDVSMMHSTKSLRYSANNQFTSIILPFENRFSNMLVVLPNNNSEEALKTCAHSVFSAENFSKLVESTKKERISLSFPRFTLERSYTLTENLQEMGLTRAFSEDAQFPGISPEPLFISKVIHKTKLVVDEDGVEAAAATAVIMDKLAMFEAEKDPIPFIVDRPFITALFDTRTNEVFFSGIIRNVESPPASEKEERTPGSGNEEL